MLGRQEESVAGNRIAGTGAQDTAGGADGETGLGAESESLYRPLKIAAIYARVSTERQEKEQTVDSQLDALYRAAREGGYEVAPLSRVRG